MIRREASVTSRFSSAVARMSFLAAEFRVERPVAASSSRSASRSQCQMSVFTFCPPVPPRGGR